MNEHIKKIVIVGGGTAGWITAGTLAAKLKDKVDSGYSITLVESPNIPIVGVGEGTWPTMRKTLKSMGIRETDFIKTCNVSFKQGAKFSKWVTGADDDFYYPKILTALILLLIGRHPLRRLLSLKRFAHKKHYVS